MTHHSRKSRNHGQRLHPKRGNQQQHRKVSRRKQFVTGATAIGADTWAPTPMLRRQARQQQRPLDRMRLT